jgi:hypothetical protein
MTLQLQAKHLQGLEKIITARSIFNRRGAMAAEAGLKPQCYLVVWLD